MILASPERIEAVRAAADAVTPDVLELTALISAVPSPTGEETAKSLLVERLFATAGLATERDAIGDVVGVIPGRQPSRAETSRLVVAAHIDTVFPIGTPLEVKRTADRLTGPGVGDNSVAVAAAIKLADLLRIAGEVPAVDVLVTGNVGEEGLGNLRGIREVLASGSDIGAVVALEGHNLGRVTHVAVGSRRFRIIVKGPGGHSWGDFGRPNAIHGLSKLIAELDAIPLPRSPKTTLNVGMISGGVSVNTIAPEASCLLDLRSIDESALRRLSDRVTRLVDRSNRGDAVVYAAEPIGERPAGVVAADSPIVQIAASTLAALGLEPSFDASSTDANVPIAAGIPAVCVGLTTGGNVHRVDEFIDLEPVPNGITQLALLTLALAESLSERAL
ncbi:MAG TPA: M20/M25/M40 family metallo-hydrolase [Thermomicrobiales bacterium]|nr:M20/M25/M40 family metallo-hydrolase [Thermomicrobiales bacterium]